MRAVLIAMSLFTLFALGGCADSATDPAGGQGIITMRMVDSPAEAEAVVIAVSRVEVHMAGSDSTSGWRTVNDQPATYDLLTLRNGASAVLGGATLDAGHYTQIRLILGGGSYVTVGGTDYPLVVSSGSQSGVKLNHQFSIEAGQEYELFLDFDAERSVRMTNSGEYRLSPVIRVQRADSSGSISGTVAPSGAAPYIWTTVGPDTVSTNAKADGVFKLMALPAGTYTVNIESKSGQYQSTSIAGVVVTKMSDNNIGLITLSPK